MRKKIIAANWKMNMTQAEASAFVSTFLLELREAREVEVVLVPPFTAIVAVNAALGQAQHIKVGDQNMYWERSGAFTGEISPAMLRDLFVRYVVLGHSERRTLFGETDEIVNRKVRWKVLPHSQPELSNNTRCWAKDRLANLYKLFQFPQYLLKQQY